MKILIAALSAALMLTGCVNTSKANKPLIALGKAPEFSLKNVLGGELKSDDFKGKIVVVDFWATWCVPCKKEIPEYVKLRETLKGSNVEFLGVTFDAATGEAVKPFMEDLGITYPVVLATDAVDVGFGGHNGYPTTFLVGRDWKVYRRFLGSPVGKIESLEKDINTLLATSKDVPVKEPTTAGN
jgi:thiol-disulfide isomerase/thioredoxin